MELEESRDLVTAKVGTLDVTVDKNKINELVDTLTPYTLKSFGTELKGHLQESGEKALKEMNSIETDEVEASLGQLSSNIKEFKKKQGGLAKTLTWFKATALKDKKAQAMQRDTLANIGVVVDNLKEYREEMYTDVEKMRSIAESSASYYKEAEEHIRALDETINSLDPNAEDYSQDYMDDLMLKREDLATSQVVIYNQIPQLQLNATNNVNLIQGLDRAINQTVPLLQTSSAINQYSEKSKRVSGELDRLNQLGNDIIKDTSTKSKETATSIAKMRENGVIKTSTIKEVMKTTADTVKIIEDSRAKMLEVKTKQNHELESLKKQFGINVLEENTTKNRG